MESQATLENIQKIAGSLAALVENTNEIARQLRIANEREAERDKLIEFDGDKA